MTEENTKEIRRKPRRKFSLRRFLCRFAISFGLAIVMLVILLWDAMFAVAHGPSDTMRDLLVGMAMQASATKFLPYTVLSSDEVDDILARASVDEDYTPTDFQERYIKKIITNENGERIEITVLEGDDGTAVVTDDSGSTVVEYDEWDYAIDGIQYITFSRNGFKAYVMLIKDPSRVYIGTSSDFTGNKAGKSFYEMADQENCVAMINAGEFDDAGGTGNGGTPLGFVFSKGKCLVKNDRYSWKTFIGFNTDNKLIVEDGLKSADIEALNIRDGVSFRPLLSFPSSRLIYTDESGEVHVTSFSDRSLSQRCAIGQRADGTVIFVVTDGRSAEHIGATYNEVTQIMYEYGAVTAGMLDGGNSALMYYRNYYELFNIDTSTLDKYQKQGVVNDIQILRKVPTFFCVSATGGAE